MQLDSLTGLTQFIDRVGEKKVDAGNNSPQMKKALDALHLSIEKEALAFPPESARENIFRLAVIANERRGHLTGDTNYDKRVKKAVPLYRRGLLRTTGQALHIHPDYQERADELVDELIIDGSNKDLTPKHTTAEIEQKLRRNYKLIELKLYGKILQHNILKEIMM